MSDFLEVGDKVSFDQGALSIRFQKTPWAVILDHVPEVRRLGKLAMEGAPEQPDRAGPFPPLLRRKPRSPYPAPAGCKTASSTSSSIPCLSDQATAAPCADRDQSR